MDSGQSAAMGAKVARRPESALIAAIGTGTCAFAFQVSAFLAMLPTISNFPRLRVASAAAAYSSLISTLKGPRKIIWGTQPGVLIPLFATVSIILLNVIADHGWSFAKIGNRNANETLRGTNSRLRSDLRSRKVRHVQRCFVAG